MSPVATEGVEEEGESKAEDGADEEEEEDQLLADLQVGVALVAQRLHIEDDRAHYEGYETDQVSPDVPWKQQGFGRRISLVYNLRPVSLCTPRILLKHSATLLSSGLCENLMKVCLLLSML